MKALTKSSKLVVLRATGDVMTEEAFKTVVKPDGVYKGHRRRDDGGGLQDCRQARRRVQGPQDCIIEGRDSHQGRRLGVRGIARAGAGGEALPPRPLERAGGPEGADEGGRGLGVRSA